MNSLEDKIQKGKTTLGEKVTCSLEVLSPVHVGSGIKLQKDFDFITESNYTLIFSKEEIEKLIIENPELIDEFDKPGFKPSSFLKKISSPRRFNIKCEGRDILEFERNGNGIPYIPGSSFKGAIRTVLLYDLFKTKTTSEQKELLSKINYLNQKLASESILIQLFGADSNHNIFRSISIGDICLDNKNINLLKTYVLSLSSENSFKWKIMGRNSQNTENIREATAIYSEMINPGSKANFNIRLDDFLFNNKEAKSELKLASFTITELAKKVNNYSKTKIQNEIKFIDNINLNNKLETVKKNLEDTENKISVDNTNEFIMRLSWGSGWKGMTGDFLDPAILSEVRKKFKIGKFGFDIFPKSRKIVFNGEVPSYYTGWVMVKFNNSFTDAEISESQIMHSEPESKTKNNPSNVSLGNYNTSNKKENESKKYIKGIVSDFKAKPPKVKILEGDFKDQETILPGVNLINLEIKDGSIVEVELSIDKKKKLEKAIYKGKVDSNPESPLV